MQLFGWGHSANSSPPPLPFSRYPPSHFQDQVELLVHTHMEGHTSSVVVQTQADERASSLLFHVCKQLQLPPDEYELCNIRSNGGTLYNILIQSWSLWFLSAKYDQHTHIPHSVSILQHNIVAPILYSQGGHQEQGGVCWQQAERQWKTLCATCWD